VLGGASDDQGSSGAEGLMDMANVTLQEMIEGGTLRSGEYERMVIPTYNRTLKEFEAPFSAGQKESSLKLESSSEIVLPDPFWPEYEQSGDARAFADDDEEFFRAAYGPSLFGALDANRTPGTRANSRRLLRLSAKKVAADPATAACHWHVALLLIVKKSDA
jgi:hypothetical protein